MFPGRTEHTFDIGRCLGLHTISDLSNIENRNQSTRLLRVIIYVGYVFVFAEQITTLIEPIKPGQISGQFNLFTEVFLSSKFTLTHLYLS